MQVKNSGVTAAYICAALLWTAVCIPFALAQEIQLSRFEHEGVTIEAGVATAPAKEDQPAKDTLTLRIRVPRSAGYSVSEVPSPSRLVFDINAPALKSNKRFNLPQNALVGRIRLGGQAEPRVRVVLDLNSDIFPEYRLGGEKETIEVVLTGRAAPSFPAAPSLPTEPGLPAAEVPPGPQPSPEPPKAEPVEKEGKRPAAPVIMRINRTPAPGREPALSSVEQAELASRLVQKIKLDFSIDKLYVEFESSNRPVEDISVRNRSDHTIYMTSEVFELVNPGTPQQEARASREVLVSPKRFELPPGGERTVRLVASRKPADAEKPYRVSFSPQADSFEAQRLKLEIGGAERLYTVLTGLALLAVVPPQDPRLNMTWGREDDLVTITNSGNVNFSLDNGRACQAALKRCKELPTKRLFPGTSWRLRAPPTTFFEFIRRTGEGYEKVSIPPA